MSDQIPTARRRAVLAAAGTTAIAGCATFRSETETGEPAEVEIRLRNDDDQSHEYTVTVNWGNGERSVFSGTLGSGAETSVRSITNEPSPDADYRIEGPNGSIGRTWDPTECGDFLVEATLSDGEPSFETQCRS